LILLFPKLALLILLLQEVAAVTVQVEVVAQVATDLRSQANLRVVDHLQNHPFQLVRGWLIP
jgi:hypothetical protein